MWTTGGHHADYCFLLTRTDPESPKHKGISYLLVPMRQPGVEVRGITQPDGTAEFCEVFFTDARCPKDNVVGGVNNGWKVANSTLAFERGQSATTGYRRFEEEYKLLVEQAAANGALADPIIRQRLCTVLHQDPAAAHQRIAFAVGDVVGHQGSRRRRARRDQQDVLERDAQGGHGAGARHLRTVVDARRYRSGRRLVAGRSARQAPPRLPGQPDDQRRSSSVAARRSGVAPARSSATSSASASSAFPKSRPANAVTTPDEIRRSSRPQTCDLGADVHRAVRARDRIAALALFVYIGVMVPLLPRLIEEQLGGNEIDIGLNLATSASPRCSIRPTARPLRRTPRAAVRRWSLGALLAAAATAACTLIDIAVGAAAAARLAGNRRSGAVRRRGDGISDLAAAGPRRRSGELLLGRGVRWARHRPGDQRDGDRRRPVRRCTVGAPPASPCWRRRWRMLDPERRPASPRRGRRSWSTIPSGGHSHRVGAGVRRRRIRDVQRVHARLLRSPSGSIGSKWVFATYAGVCLLIRVVAATVPDRIGHARAVSIALSLMATGLTMLFVWPHPLGVFISTVIVGIGISFNYPGLMAMTVEAVPENERVRAISTFTMFFEIGTAMRRRAVRHHGRPHHETDRVPRRRRLLRGRAVRLVAGGSAAITAVRGCLISASRSVASGTTQLRS